MKGTASNSHSRFSNRALVAISIVLFVVLFAAGIVAQTATATLSGSVVDERDAAIPGADITIVNTGTGARRNTTTNKDGYFTLPLLPPSQYTLTVQREGFTTVQVPDIVLNVGDQKALQIMLKVGQVDAAIEVRPEGTLVDTSPSVSTTVDRTFVSNLPLNGRSFQSLILLTPGVTVKVSGDSDIGGFSVNGQRGNANYFTVDGVSSNISVNTFASRDFMTQQLAGTGPGLTAFGGTNNLVSVDALEQFKIQTSTYSAEFGRQPGAQVQLVTRSGGNRFHGTLFEYFRNEALDANNWFANSAGRKKAQLRQNQFGGTFSGPVFLPNIGDGGPRWYDGKDRTFFFFSYEGLRLRLPFAFVAEVPSLRVRQGAAPAVRPLLDAFPLPDGPERLGVNGQPLGYAPFNGSYGAPQEQELDSTSIRVDHAINKKLSLFGRYNQAPSSSLRRAANIPGIRGSRSETRTLTVGVTAILSPRLSNELRFNYSRNRAADIAEQDGFGGAVPVDRSVLVSGYTGTGLVGGNAGFSFPGLPGTLIVLEGGEADSYQRQFNVVDNVSLTKGSHQLKFGLDYRRLAPIYGPREFFQGVTFSNEAAIRSGTVSGLFISAAQEVRPLFDNFSAYAQDTWKASPRLTLDFGLRWELNPPPGEGDGKKPVLVSGIDDLTTAALAPLGTPLYKTFYGAFAPRFGVAYQVSQKSGRELALRGGFGVYYDVGNSQSIGGFSGFPFNSSVSYSNVSYPIPAALVMRPSFPNVTLPVTSELRAVDPDLKLPYTLQWNISVEQSLGTNQTVTASYVAAAGRRLLTTQSLNNIIAGARPNPNFGRIVFVTNGPTSDYHSMQLQFQRRLSRGLQALINYTWSHAIDEISTELITVFAGSQLLRGNADFDVRHNFSSALTYNLPTLHAGKLLTALLRNWSVDAIAHAQSGQPVDVFFGSLTLVDGKTLRIRPDLISGAPLYVKDPTVPGQRRFNSAAFQAPPLGSGDVPLREGTFGRNVLRLLPLRQVDFALRRQFNISEAWKLQLKAEAFNVFNHPNFGSVGTFFTNPSAFGVPSATLNNSLGGLSSLYQIGGPRSIQLSLKMSF